MESWRWFLFRLFYHLLLSEFPEYIEAGKSKEPDAVNSRSECHGKNIYLFFWSEAARFALFFKLENNLRPFHEWVDHHAMIRVARDAEPPSQTSSASSDPLPLPALLISSLLFHLLIPILAASSCSPEEILLHPSCTLFIYSANLWQ